MGITPYRLVQELGVTGPRVYDLVKGERPITADMALRLARFFGNSALFWMNAQAGYDLKMAERAVGKKIAKQVHPVAA